MGLQLQIRVMYAAVLVAAAQQRAAGLCSSQHTAFAGCFLKMLLKPLIHR